MQKAIAWIDGAARGNPGPAAIGILLTDEHGNKISVVLDIEEYEKILEELEELEDIREYEEAKASNDPAIPLQQALDEIERKRR